jgi:hypothetical protein
MYYYPKKELALEEAKRWEQDFDTRAELEPYNGWIIVLMPREFDVLRTCDLEALLTEVEIDLTRFQRLRRRPQHYRKPSAVPIPDNKQEKEPEVAPTWKPGQKLPWEK